MPRTNLLPLAALTLALVLISPDTESGEEQPGCGDVWQREPVLMYNVTGGTLVGLVHKSLVVYNDGTSIYSELPPGGEEPVVMVETVPAGDVTRMMQGLHLDGAFDLCDQNIGVFDVPMRTVTVFRGASDSLAHSFNYWLAYDGYLAVQETLDGFLASAFGD